MLYGRFEKCGKEYHKQLIQQFIEQFDTMLQLNAFNSKNLQSSQAQGHAACHYSDIYMGTITNT